MNYFSVVAAINVSTHGDVGTSMLNWNMSRYCIDELRRDAWVIWGMYSTRTFVVQAFGITTPRNYRSEASEGVAGLSDQVGVL